MDIDITIKNDGNGRTLAKISGWMDTNNAYFLQEKIETLLTDSFSEIILDCSDLEYISSSGLRLFLTLQKYMNIKEGRLIIKNLRPNVKEIFDMTGFSRIMTIVSTGRSL